MCLVLYFQGEPYLNPDFLSMVGYARGKGLYVITSTNGHFLDEESARQTVESGLSRLIVSVDGATQATYSAYRIGGDLEQVRAGIRRVVAWKKRLGRAQPHVILQCLVVRPNEHEIADVRAMGRELGVDEVKFKTAQVYDYENGHALIPSIDRYARYRRGIDGRWRLKASMSKSCWKMWHSCVITWDGRVAPCCFDKDAAHQMGDLRRQDFGAIWRGKAYADFRALLSKGREHIDICRNCSEGCKVWER
ncbi:MAG: radical SAM/SPASM domain-containing protein, partial [Saprospiraceae bacterium]